MTALEQRVSALESERVQLLADWTAYQDMFSRYLKKLAQRDRRDRPGNGDLDPISAAILERRGLQRREE